MSSKGSASQSFSGVTSTVRFVQESWAGKGQRSANFRPGNQTAGARAGRTLALPSRLQRRNGRKLALQVCSAALAVALAACSAADDEPPDDSPPPLPTEKQSESAPVPEFTGPWANDFREAYLSTANSLARGILADGAVSDSEMSEATAAYQSCLEGQGFTVEYLNSDGSMSFSPPLNPAGEPLDTAEALRTQQQCAGETAWNHISALHTFTRSNPENEDSLLLIARCLVRVGLRPEGYSADDYGSEAMSGVFEGWLQPDAPENERFSACQKDPLQAT